MGRYIQQDFINLTDLEIKLRRSYNILSNFPDKNSLGGCSKLLHSMKTDFG